MAGRPRRNGDAFEIERLQQYLARCTLKFDVEGIRKNPGRIPIPAQLANSILQFAPVKVLQSTGRVVVNSTVGLLGLIDVATKMDIPRPSEDFGQTLGHYGVGAGPYLVMPLLGPSSLRDGTGVFIDSYATGLLYEEFMSTEGRYVVQLIDAIDTRANVPFRYYETGQAFEYDTLRWLYSTKREIDIAK